MVADGDLDTDGVSITAGRIALNGGTIQDLADNPAVLAYEAVPPQPGHAVDGSGRSSRARRWTGPH